MCLAPSYDCEGPAGIITSPYYPMPFEGSTRCLWYINTPDNSYIRILFTHYILPPSWISCSESSLRLVEDPDGRRSVIDEYCAERAPPDGPIETSLNFFEMELKVGLQTTGIVFMLEYEAAYFEAPLVAQPENDTGILQ